MRRADTAPPPQGGGTNVKAGRPAHDNAGSSEGSAVRIQRLCSGDHPSHGAIATGVAVSADRNGIHDNRSRD